MRYETLYLVHPSHEGPALEEVVAAVAAAAETAGVEVTGHTPLGRRRLAYPIAGVEEGSYVAITYQTKPGAPAGAVERFERDLRLREPVLRHMTVRLEG